jgi:hypothetical protein
MERAVTRRLPILALAGCLLLGACSSGDDANAGTGGTTAPPSGTAAAPTGAPLVPGLPVVELLGPPSTGAGEAPLFRWTAVDGAESYALAVVGPDGPLWAWRGQGTEVYLGGLPFERPPGWAGPVLVPGSCWSVVARDAAGAIVAVSALVPASPDQTAGTCTPGAGEEPSG